MQLPKKLFDALEEVRYVALCRNDELSLHQRADLTDASESTSDHYEELLVNPTVLLLTQRRGRIDCGGLDYVLIRYGNFFQFVQPTADGHISIAIEKTADIPSTIEAIQSVIRDNQVL